MSRDFVNFGELGQENSKGDIPQKKYTNFLNHLKVKQND